MRKSLSTTLIAAGTTVGVLAGIGMATGAQITLPPALLTIVVYKALFAAAGGLIAAGALIGRSRRRLGPPPPSAEQPPALPEPRPDELSRMADARSGRREAAGGRRAART